MNAQTSETVSQRVEGGYYVGRLRPPGCAPYALIVAPKALGEHDSVVWNRSLVSVDGALSYHDGLANTIAMAKAGSRLAQWALDLTIDGIGGYYIPALDELEVCYRHLKPGVQPNSLWYRSGINMHAEPPTPPYTAEFPCQTALALFHSGGTEAFEETPYWTSTQPASYSDFSWTQTFHHGYQATWTKTIQFRARAVRRSFI